MPLKFAEFAQKKDIIKIDDHFIRLCMRHCDDICGEADEHPPMAQKVVGLIPATNKYLCTAITFWSGCFCMYNMQVFTKVQFIGFF